MKKFNVDSRTYNDLALLALGIAGQETEWGTSRRYAAKELLPDSVKTAGRVVRAIFSNGNASRAAKEKTSRGMTQIKIEGDNADMQRIYKQYGITSEALASNDYQAAGLATMLRLLHMYTTEVRGGKFRDANGNAIKPTDALMYLWTGKGSMLRSGKATPEQNIYLNNVKGFTNYFDIYEYS